MSEKRPKRPVSKNEETKALNHFEDNNYQENDLHANRNKIEQIVQFL